MSRHVQNQSLNTLYDQKFMWTPDLHTSGCQVSSIMLLGMVAVWTWAGWSSMFLSMFMKTCEPWLVGLLQSSRLSAQPHNPADSGAADCGLPDELLLCGRPECAPHSYFSHQYAEVVPSNMQVCLCVILGCHSDQQDWGACGWGRSQEDLDGGSVRCMLIHDSEDFLLLLLLHLVLRLYDLWMGIRFHNCMKVVLQDDLLGFCSSTQVENELFFNPEP